MDTTTGIDRAAATRALVAAATAAALAPSVHNTQPWRWRIQNGTADLYADTRRQLHITDPDRRLLLLSCGAALHHACVALAADGIAVDVVRMADPDDMDRQTVRLPVGTDPDHLATITVTGSIPVTDDAMRRFQTTEIRHTDRRALLDESLPPTALAALRSTAESYGVGFHLLDRDQVIDLAGATDRAQRDEHDDPAAQAELDAWTGPHHPIDAGIPSASIPAGTVQTTVGMRNFGQIGTLPITWGHDNFASYAILYGLAEQPRGWLRAGEALSAIWLTATEHMVAVLPLSAAVESPATRQALRRMLAGVGYPYLALRLRIADPAQSSPPRTPRLGADVNIAVFQ